MILYKCDMCGDVRNKEGINIIEHFPRRLRTYAKDTIGVKLVSFETFGFAETHLCNICCEKVAASLKHAEED